VNTPNLVHGGRVLTVDAGAVAARAQGAAEELFERRRALPDATASPATALGKT
jgi:hypothetical protein